jgi:hypothetical protein
MGKRLEPRQGLNGFLSPKASGILYASSMFLPIAGPGLAVTTARLWSVNLPKKKRLIKNSSIKVISRSGSGIY